MGWGIVAWSLLTAASGTAWNYVSLLLMRVGVGVGEASYAPAANSTIADLYPAGKRARAFGLFQLGLPVGLVLAYFSVGAIAEAFGTWRAPFVLAAIPGLLIAAGFFLVREPAAARPNWRRGPRPRRHPLPRRRRCRSTGRSAGSWPSRPCGS